MNTGYANLIENDGIFYRICLDHHNFLILKDEKNV